MEHHTHLQLPIILLSFSTLLPCFLSASSLLGSLDLDSFPKIIALSSAVELVCDVTSFGAKGDGILYDTEAIQRAINACGDAGGGIVLFSHGGQYLTGTIFLRSNITLHIQRGATLLGSPDQQHYPLERDRWFVILAENVSHVGVTGGGVVDGQGLKFVAKFDERKNVMVSWNETGACLGDECRPKLVGFRNCKHVHVWNIHLQEPAYWCLYIKQSDEIWIHNLSIYGDFNIPNNDGIDIEDSNNTFITKCHIDTGDDAICPKAYDGPVYNLTVTACWIRTKSCAIKLGSATYFDFHNLWFENIEIMNSHRGLGLQLRDSGNIYDVTFSNIRISTQYYDPSWWGRAEPIYVTACPREPSTKVGSIFNVHFNNITATSENGIFLSGSGGGFLHDISFSNVQVELKRWTSYEGGLFDYRPGCQGLVPHRNSGLFMENISRLTMHKVRLLWNSSQQLSVLPLDFSPSTIGYINLSSFESILQK